MKTITRFLWFGSLILILAGAACAPSETSTPTALETFSAGPTSPEETGTASTAETATGLTGTASPSGTLEGTETASTSGTAVGSPTSETLTPGIPVTGLDVNVVDCQFCLDDLAHALLIMPDTSSFKVVSSTSSTTNAIAATCTTVEVSNGRQVVLCSGSANNTLTVNVCTNSGTCADVPVELFDCPEAPGTAGPTETPGGVTGGATATSTPSPSGLATDTATPTP